MGSLSSRSSRNILSSRRNLRISSSRSISSNLPRNLVTVSRSNRNSPVMDSSRPRNRRNLVTVSRSNSNSSSSSKVTDNRNSSSNQVTDSSRNKVTGSNRNRVIRSKATDSNKARAISSGRRFKDFKRRFKAVAEGRASAMR